MVLTSVLGYMLAGRYLIHNIVLNVTNHSIMSPSFGLEINSSFYEIEERKVAKILPIHPHP